MGFYNTVFFKLTRRIRSLSGIHALETNQARLGGGACVLRSLFWASSNHSHPAGRPVDSPNRHLLSLESD